MKATRAYAAVSLVLITLASCAGNPASPPAGPLRQELWTDSFPPGTLTALAVDRGRACIFCTTLRSNLTQEQSISLRSMRQAARNCGAVGSVYVLDQKLNAIALDGAKGSALRTSGRYEKEARLEAIDGKIFITGKTVRAFNEETGKPLWSFTSGKSTYRMILLSGSGSRARVRVRKRDALRLGFAFWKGCLEDQGGTSDPSIDGNLGYYSDHASRSNRLHVIDSRTGKERCMIQDYEWQTIGKLTAGSGLIYMPMHHARNELDTNNLL